MKLKFCGLEQLQRKLLNAYYPQNIKIIYFYFVHVNMNILGLKKFLDSICFFQKKNHFKLMKK